MIQPPKTPLKVHFDYNACQHFSVMQCLNPGMNGVLRAQNVAAVLVDSLPNPLFPTLEDTIIGALRIYHPFT